MTILFDTDILLDIALNRQPHFVHSAAIIDLVEVSSIEGFLAWHSAANFFYVARPQLGRGNTLDFLRHLVSFLGVPTVATTDLRNALDQPLHDFEDALQVAAAMSCRADYIVTCNRRHYRAATVPAVTPAQLIAKLSSNGE